MDAFGVGVSEPGCKRVGAFDGVVEDLAVGPFGLQGPVEAFDSPLDAAIGEVDARHLTAPCTPANI